MTRVKSQMPPQAFAKLTLNEAKLAVRLPAGLVAGLGLPLLLLIIFGSVPAIRQAQPTLGGLSYFAISYPILIGMTLLSLAAVILPRSLVSYRELGMLRRLQTTPAPPSWLLAAQVVVTLAQAFIGLILITAVGMIAFGLQTPKNLPGFVLATVLTITALFAIGLSIAAVARTNAVAQALGGLFFFVMLFFGGLWLPREIMPTVLLDTSNWTPLGASVGAIQNAMQGTTPSMQSLLCLAGYTIVFGYLAVRYFKWE